MKIIKNGNTVKENETVRFICQKCGCIYDVEKDKCIKLPINGSSYFPYKNEKKYKYECPECKYFTVVHYITQYI